MEAVWAISREMMRLASYDIPNTGISVSIDTGDALQLHPKSKKPIGIRHAYLALKNVYGKNIVANGPRYSGVSFDKNKAILKFNSIGGGLIFDKPGKPGTFALAGDDQKWQFADAEIVGDTVVLTSNVPKPVAVRYAWAMNPSQRNLLYNKEGIPASPFRTDEWPLFKKGDKLPKVFKPNKPKSYEATDWPRPEMTQ